MLQNLMSVAGTMKIIVNVNGKMELCSVQYM